MAKKLQIRQFAYGLMRIDDGSSSTNVSDPGKDKFGNPIVYRNAAWEVSAENNANGQVQPMICIPQDGALVLDGRDIKVNPPGGGVGRLHPVGNGLVMCYVAENNGVLSANVVIGQGNVPADALFSFKVAFVPMNLKANRVLQYAYGTVFATTDDGIFKIVQDAPAPALAATRGIGDDSDSGDSEDEPDPYDPTIHTRPHHFENCYYMLGERLFQVSVPSTTKVESFADEFVCLRVPATTPASSSATLVGYSTLSDLQAAQTDPAFVVKPLYKLNGAGAVEVDFRTGPHIQVAEVL